MLSEKLGTSRRIQQKKTSMKKMSETLLTRIWSQMLLEGSKPTPTQAARQVDTHLVLNCKSMPRGKKKKFQMIKLEAKTGK